MAPISTNHFPWKALVVKYEMYYSGVWNDVSSYIRQDQPGVYSELTHGRQDEATRPDPAKCKFILNNVNGRFSPRNPRSPLYGLIGRNTPFRVSIVWNGFTYYRFHGEISQWPMQWEPGGHDNWVLVEASGITRRIRRRSQPVTSPIRRYMDSQAQSTVLAYWPMEDEAGAGQFSSAVANGLPLTKRNTAGSSSFANNDDVPGSASLPSLETGYWQGQVRPYTTTSQLQLMFVISAASAPSGDALGVSFGTTGTAGAWTVVVRSDGLLELRAYARTGRALTVVISGVINSLGGSGIVDNPCRVSVELTQSGADINYNLEIYSLNNNDGAHGYSGTLAGYTIGRLTDVSVNDPGSPLGSVSVGHIWATKTMISSFDPFIYNADIAYNGEFAQVRTSRVLDENGIPWSQVFATVGDNATQMDPQPIASVSDILDECADLGYMVLDDRSGLGLLLMPLEWREDRNTGLLVDYGQVSPGMLPVEDDQGVYNDVTVRSANGTTGRAVVSTGPLSNQDPPNGVGNYPTSTSLNVYDDDYTTYWAQWLSHFGTYDEARFPSVCFDLLKDINQTVIAQVVKELENNFNTGLEVGQVLRITNLPDWLPGGPLELVINGWTEKIGPWTWEIEFNCSPAGPWRTWIVEDPATSTYDDDVSRGHVDTAGAETVGSFVAGTGTSLVVKTNSGPRWVTPADQAAAFPFDIMVSGARLRVTSIAGTSTSGQTFTVAATPVNGVTKTIPSGSAVNIVPVYVGV